MSRSWFKSGTWNAVCAVCGFEYKADQLKERWDGVKVCEKDWEPRHVLDFIQPPPPERVIPWSQPDNEDIDGFAEVTFADTPYTITSSIREILVNPEDGNITLNLPLASDYDYPGTTIMIYRTDTSANSVTVQCQGSDKIDISGFLSASLPTSVAGMLKFRNDATSIWTLIKHG